MKITIDEQTMSIYSAGEDITESVALHFNLELTPDGVVLPTQILIEAQDPEDYVLLHKTLLGIKQSLKDNKAELVREKNFQSFYDDKEYVC